MQTRPQFNFDVYYLSEHALTLQFGNQISEILLNQVIAFNNIIHQNPFAGFVTTVPAYATITVFFDPLLVSANKNLPGRYCFDKVSGYLDDMRNINLNNAVTKNNTVTIPVCYGGNYGPDIEYVAALNNFSVSEVAQLHSATIYKVYMIGFVPGFAYLGGMNSLLNAPRKATPRKVIPAGSVGIAGMQTGIYPLATPGGWQLIGQTPLLMFDAGGATPSLIEAGDDVKFKPINKEEFEHLTQSRYADSHY